VAFEANILVANIEHSEKLNELILKSAKVCLQKYGITIVSQVTFNEYNKNTTSDHINRSIRVRKKTLNTQHEEKMQVINIEAGNYRHFEEYADSKYAFFSSSIMYGGKDKDVPYTVVWFSFNSVLLKMVKSLNEFTFYLAEHISKMQNINCMVLYATSFSRRADMFTIFVNGKSRNKLSGKNALTEVKSQYEIDINTCMKSVDENLAIFYAPYDYRKIKEEMKEVKNKTDELKAGEADKEKVITDKVDGSDLNKTFAKENEAVSNSIVDRYNMVKRCLLSNPIGNVVFFKMKSYTEDYVNTLPDNETKFGRDVIIKD
jgi:hypothetical protein